jgi:Uncharacterised protein family UPF0547/Protein of unknown function (DUF2510)
LNAVKSLLAGQKTTTASKRVGNGVMKQPAGWYEDPSGKGLRYWDGAWTDQRMPFPPGYTPRYTPERRKLHPGFVFLAVISLFVAVLPAIFGFSGSFTVLWLLWGGFWTVLWWLFAKGRRKSGWLDPIPVASGAPGPAGAATKKCPDCAETVLADAKVCKRCGYRFAPAADGKAESKPHTTPTAKPRAKPPTTTSALRVGDWVKLAAPGDKNDGKTGTVSEVLDDGDVMVRFKGLGHNLGEYAYRPNQLKRLDSPTK